MATPRVPLAPVFNLLEKVLSTYVQAFLGLLLVGSALDASAAQVAAVAAIPAALTVVANGLPVVAMGLPFYVDVLFRVVRTFVATFLGVLIAMPVFRLDGSVLSAAAMAALPAALALLKALLASQVGNTQTAALLPAELDFAHPAPPRL